MILIEIRKCRQYIQRSSNRSFGTRLFLSGGVAIGRSGDGAGIASFRCAAARSWRGVQAMIDLIISLKRKIL